MQLEGPEQQPSRGRWKWALLALGLVLVALGLWWWRAARRAARAEPAAPVAATAPAVPAAPAPTVAAEPPRAAAASQAEVPAAAAAARPTPPAPVPEAASVAPAAPVGEGVSSQVLTEVDERIAADDLLGARDTALATLARNPEAGLRAGLEERLGRINTQLVLTPRMMPEKTEYIVQRGDSVVKLAQKLATTRELIEQSNQMAHPELIRQGDRLRIFRGQFTITISKSRNDLLLWLNGRFFKRYAVGTGRYGKTPTGTFVVSDRIREPVWHRPDGRAIAYGDPENILGTRWLSLKGTGETGDIRGYGIHGTWDNASVGKAESAGCVRLRNEEVEELYTLVPVGTPVTIEE